MRITLPPRIDDLVGRSVLSLAHHADTSILAVLELAARLKAASHPWPCSLAGRTVAMIFEKPSTRTRVSFETAIGRLGGTSVILNPNDMQLGRGETVEDTAIVLSRFVDAIVIRSGSHARVEELARAASVPVVNALTPLHHPCQGLADAMTLRERFGESLAGLPLAYVGDGNNCFHSLAVMAAHLGIALTCACPEGYEPNADIVARADGDARERGGFVRVVRDPLAAVAGARAVYTDVWVSMGDEAEEEERLGAFGAFQVNAELLAHTAHDAIVLHPLPAHYDTEITRDVAHGPRSAIWDEAENRLHVQAALLVHLLAPE